ncbi:MAG: chemotaxis signal transduction protein CheV [Oxalobacter sp.]|nr:MAG: chemotaxis signal transduction protein CheV [Oxalobacter sp.]
MFDGKSFQQEVDERTNLTGTNKFEMLLFRLGRAPDSDVAELFGINVFKVREIIAMPEVTAIAGSLPHMLGVVNIRGLVLPVIDLPAVVGCSPRTGLNIMLVTEFAQTAQAFAVESVEDIIRLDWNQVLPAESGVAHGMVTSIARLDTNIDSPRLVQVLDVEAILRQMSPGSVNAIEAEQAGATVKMTPGSVILAADDSHVARTMLDQGLTAMGLPFIMTKSGKEAWEKLQSLFKETTAEGKNIMDRVALVLTDLEMPEMDGFTLTRNIKSDNRFSKIPVVIHSSLTGTANEAHVRNVGADAYVAKFDAPELAKALRTALKQPEPT